MVLPPVLPVAGVVLPPDEDVEQVSKLTQGVAWLQEESCGRAIVQHFPPLWQAVQVLPLQLTELWTGEMRQRDASTSLRGIGYPPRATDFDTISACIALLDDGSPDEAEEADEGRQADNDRVEAHVVQRVTGGGA